MPGIVGLIRTRHVKSSLDEALRKIMHFPSYVSQELRLNDRILLGQVWRNEKRVNDDWYFDSTHKIGIFINGTIFTRGHQKRRLTARDIWWTYERDAMLHPEDYDGGFVIVLCDLRKDLLRICNDRLGTLPIYYMLQNDALCFGPEVKAVLTAIGAKPRLSKAGVINFISSGYCIGQTTLYEGVQILEPGCKLSVNLKSLEIEYTRYWKMIYAPSKHLRSRKAAEDALYDSLLEAHKLILCDGPRAYDLLLSGGMDSRSILAFLNQLQCLPRRAFGWGLRDDIPHSDAFVAKSIAHKYGVRYDFISYDTDSFIQNAQEWCWLSELANDNVGWYAEGSSVLSKDYNTGADFALVGDECWGIRGYTYNEKEAIEFAHLPSELPTELRLSLYPDIVDEYEHIYREQIQSILSQCENEELDDRKDFLYLHGRVARLIFSLGYYKELATELRRPFLVSSVLEVVRQMPVKFRLSKNAYVSMLKKRFPLVMSLPKHTVSSLPDWEYDLRTKPGIREFFLKYLSLERISLSILGELFEPRAFKKIRDEFFQAEERVLPRVQPSRIVRMKNKLSPLAHRSWHIGKLYRAIRKEDRKPPRTSFDFLRCVALITLLEEQLRTFGSGDTLNKQ